MSKCAKCGSEVGESGICPSCDATVAVAASVPPSASSNVRSLASRFTTTDESRFIPGALLAGRYRIVALLGKGGMGEVYRADDLTLGQQVALKFLPPAMARNEDALRRFHNEVRIARKVSHPNVCRVYDLGEVDGHMFLSMEYVDGEDLGSLLRRIGRLPTDKALEIARKLCAGLAAAHDQGVLHRDLKPANIMLDSRGQVLLTDFGLAGLADQITGVEVRSGTPAYMAPEQLAGKEVTIQSDLYSLGLVIYELFSGKRPFEGDSLADLTRARNEKTPVSLTSLVSDLDPTVERVILRCLAPEPSRRPKSALAVSAALPGGDPLAAALAAGETPSPQMVAAAGEGEGLSLRVAIPVFIAILLGIVVCSTLAIRRSAIERIQPEYPPEVLRQKARDILRDLGYTARPADEAWDFDWEYAFRAYVGEHEKPFPGWDQILTKRPTLLRFGYRQSPWPLIGISFHDDLLTPGIVNFDDPPPVLSGMISLTLDSEGRLNTLEAIPPQERETTGKPVPEPDWNALFRAAALDPAQFQPAPPIRNWLASYDARMAWTGSWPGSKWPLRVEAAAFQGKPVAFALIGPWTKPDRLPPPESLNSEMVSLVILGCITLAVFVGGPLLARRNLAAGKGDRRGAFRLAAFIFCAQMALWVTRSHMAPSIGTFGVFLLAVCTASFYALILWTVYLALEPYVRRYWPRTIISWTRVLSGQIRDPIVGRDVLFGVALGVSWALIDRLTNLWSDRTSPSLGLFDTDLLLDSRRALGGWLQGVPHGVREALVFFFMLFLLRLLLRNQWLGGAAFVLIWTAVMSLGNSSDPVLWGFHGAVSFTLAVAVVLRFGLLALSIGVFASGLVGRPPTLQTSAWYFANSAFMWLTVVALATWAFQACIGGRRPSRPA
jgi:serine/threonine-protein kinase